MSDSEAGTGIRKPEGHPHFTSRLVHNHLRLWTSLCVALLSYAGLAVVPQLSPEAVPHVPPTVRFLLAFDVGALVWLMLACHLMASSDAGAMRRRAEREDEGAVPILLLAGLATLAAVVAVVVEAGHTAGAQGGRSLHVALAIVTLIVSWFFFHSIVTLHYAREYYAPRAAAGGRTPLEFPGTPEPDYWDFCYFGFNIGAATQTPDVNVTTRRMRRIVIVHQIASYLFNAAVIALGVNVAAGLM